MEIIDQIDRLEKAAEEARNKLLGHDWFKKCEEVYALNDDVGRSYTYRPSVRIPQLQVLSMSEAVALAEADPVIYIASKGKRQKEREKAFQAAWDEGGFNYEILNAVMWAMFTSTGFVEVGFDPSAKGGLGKLWLKALDPQFVLPDPTGDPFDWEYVIVTRWLNRDELVATYGDAAERIPDRPAKSPGRRVGSQPSYVLPPGPMREMGDPTRPAERDSTLVKTRFTYIRDYRMIPAGPPEPGHSSAYVAPALEKAMFPNGRKIVDAGGITLFDGDNPVPNGMFPIVPVWGIPPLKGVWGVPPSRYTYSLQELAQKMYSQVYENAFRTNNASIFVYNNSGLTEDDPVGLPAQIHVINQNSHPPEFKWPNPMPAHMVQLPALLLTMQKELQGYSAARQGNPGAGNISADLYEASLYQSQPITRLRALYLARSVERIASIGFTLMGRYLTKDCSICAVSEDGMTEHKWQPMEEEELEQTEVRIDPNSVRAYSQTSISRLVPVLRNLGLLDTRTALELAKVPNPDKVEERLTEEQTLAALANIKRTRR